jgi:hypothetical protein
MSARIKMTADREAALASNTPLTPESPAGLELEMGLNALVGQQDLLQDDIKRGRECLCKVQLELAERRASLEEWPTYEQRCGVSCLPHLTGAVVASRRIERFLKQWLGRRQKQLEEVERAIELSTRQNQQAPPAGASLAVPLHPVIECNVARAA